ncbi:zinc finger protein ZAT2-like [Aristolochia californica]|uniref:zinc finger protein ZAT2-like n=1 Tax=Aristolochia californica TaxID=171875 RepID=UPI0035DFEAEA
MDAKLKKDGGNLTVELRPPSFTNWVRCSECNKQFTSPKALFGHMRCHPDRNWRGMHPPLRASSTVEQECDTALLLLMLAKGSGSSHGKWRKRRCQSRLVWVDGRVHECRICHRVFPTGQALGGHKRCHWGEKDKAGQAKDELVIDLNEPAPLSEEDMEAAYGMMEVIPASMKSISQVLALGCYPNAHC